MQSNDDKRRGTLWNDLPNEVILDIAGAAEFDFAMLCNLQLVDRRLHHILKTYERSLCKGYAANQLLHVIPYFPDLVSPQCGTCSNVGCASGLSFSLLAEVQRRSTALATLTREVFRLAPVCCCLHGWHQIFKAGMLLLYRLSERWDYDEKVNFIMSMPLHALVTIFVALAQSIRAAQIGGSGLIHRDSQPDDPSARSDIHLVFEDLVLQAGPELVIDTLNHDKRAEHVLKVRYTSLEEMQTDDADGTPPRKSFISQLKRAFAAECECRISEVMSKAMELAQTRPLRNMEEADVINLVRFDEGVGYRG
ncbi:hypothetical protein DIS24_g9478 [Lasiodiplodia hormozganensis]|uniref:F-box domain-containing protein n=1 Tax=Lasiodiplodia hormozganensis TaxID=869390 RepID=A0AA39XU82_9PEZI|nr:hypothetical protein DIS24_g9478 [Lasiodiplodia hormozganensis]